jgi:hypothetical protein
MFSYQKEGSELKTDIEALRRYYTRGSLLYV